MMLDFTTGFVSALLIVIVCSRSPIDQRSSSIIESATDNLESDPLLRKIEELDQMIQIAKLRHTRSVEDEDDIVGEKEMINVMGRVDLDVQDNVEAVADVMKTLSGETQLEFLMKKFMMVEEDNEAEKSKRSTHEGKFKCRYTAAESSLHGIILEPGILFTVHSREDGSKSSCKSLST